IRQKKPQIFPPPLRRNFFTRIPYASAQHLRSDTIRVLPLQRFCLHISIPHNKKFLGRGIPAIVYPINKCDLPPIQERDLCRHAPDVNKEARINPEKLRQRQGVDQLIGNIFYVQSTKFYADGGTAPSTHAP